MWEMSASFERVGERERLTDSARQGWANGKEERSWTVSGRPKRHMKWRSRAERHFQEIETGWDGAGPVSGREDEAQRKEKLRGSERAELVTAGPRLEKAGAETIGSPGEGVRTQVRASRPLRTPAAWGWGARVHCAPSRRGEKRLG